jgi:hypothetical protein
MEHIHSARQVRCFFYTITRNPALANAVHHLELDDWDYTDPDPDPNCPLEYNEELIDKAVNGTIWSDQPKEQLKLGDPDAWLALLIPQLKCLKQIHLPFSNEPHYAQAMFRKASNEPIPVFPMLEYVSTSCLWWPATIDEPTWTLSFDFPQCETSGHGAFWTILGTQNLIGTKNLMNPL